LAKARCGVKPVKTPSKAVTGPGILGLADDLDRAQATPPGTRKSMKRKVKRQTQKTA